MKLEFLDGQVWAMSGGTPDHARVTTNVSTMLSIAVRDRPCAVYSPDLRVRSKTTGLGTYADATVIGGEVELDPDDPKRHTALNPYVPEHGLLRSVALDVDRPLSDIYRDPMASIR